MPYRCRLLVTGVDALRLPSGNDAAFGQKPVGLRASTVCYQSHIACFARQK